MARFDRQIASALRLIQKNGQQITWKQLGRTPDVAEPWKVTSVPPVEFTPYICFLPISKENREFVNFIRGTNELKVGSLLGLMGAVSFEPSLEDLVVRDGRTLELMSLDLLSPNGQKLLYTIEFK